MATSSGFLVGPTQQVKLMLKPIRRIATIIYLAMIAVVVIVAVAVRQMIQLDWVRDDINVVFIVFSRHRSWDWWCFY